MLALLRLSRPVVPTLSVGMTLYCDCGPQFSMEIVKFVDNPQLFSAKVFNNDEQEGDIQSMRFAHCKVSPDGETLDKTGWIVEG